MARNWMDRESTVASDMRSNERCFSTTPRAVIPGDQIEAGIEATAGGSQCKNTYGQ